MKPTTGFKPTKNIKLSLGYGDYLRFSNLVLERSGLHFPEKKKPDLEIGLSKALMAAPVSNSGSTYNLDSYYTLLSNKNDPVGRAEMKRLISFLTVGETYFFRDEPQFNALTNHILPSLITAKREAATAVGSGIQPQLRIWSAGCATGEEPYSLAILLRELIPDIENWHIVILATDINQDSLSRARQAIYSEWSFREIRAKALRSTYFSRVPPPNRHLTTSRYRLNDDVRQMVTFAPLNLIEDEYPAIHNNTVSMDLILCRNVTIYFTQEITWQVVQQFHKSLVDNGWLIVGHSEPSLMGYRAFQPVSFKNTLLYKKTDNANSWPADFGWTEEKSQSKYKSDIKHKNTPITSAPSRLNTNFKPAPVMRSQIKNAPKPSPPSPISSVQQDQLDACKEAQTLLENGKSREAIAILHRKIETSPYCAQAQSLLGRAYANLSQWSEAHRWCKSALELDNLQTDAYYVLSLVYQHEEDNESAINMLKKAVYLDRDVPLLHFQLALLYKKTGQLQNAHRACQNTIKILQKLPSDAIVPDTGGSTVGNLLRTVQLVLTDVEKQSGQSAPNKR